MRDEEHYRGMLDENPDVYVDTILAASMIYAARHGVCESADRNDEWRAIIRRLNGQYGENLNNDQISREMDASAGDCEMILSELATATGLHHDQLRQAINDDRLYARQLYHHGPWLSTIANVEAALEAGTLQRRPGRPRIR